MIIHFHFMQNSQFEHDDLISCTCKCFVTFYDDFERL